MSKEAIASNKYYKVDGFSFHRDILEKMTREKSEFCPLCRAKKDDKKYLLCSECVRTKGAKASLKKALFMCRMGWSQKYYQKKFDAFLRTFRWKEGQKDLLPFSDKLWEAGVQHLLETYNSELPQDVIKGIAGEAFRFFSHQSLYELIRQHLFQRGYMVNGKRLAEEVMERYKLEVSLELMEKVARKVLAENGDQAKWEHKKKVFEECLEIARSYLRQNPGEKRKPTGLANLIIYKHKIVTSYGSPPHPKILERAFRDVFKEKSIQEVKHQLERSCPK